MNKLYTNILKSVLKGLYESLFSDDDLDILSEPDSVELLNGQEETIIKNTLCVKDEYCWVYPSDDFPFILKDEQDPTRYYIAPFRNYETENMGPRKRKKYTTMYFYRYILDFNDDGTISLSIMRNSLGNGKLVISPLIVDFLSKTSYNVKEIKFHKPENTYIPFNEQFERIIIISANSTYKNRKYSDKFVYNFPDIISPGGRGDNGTEATVFRSWFSSDEMFILMVTKLINSNFWVRDENGYLYTKSILSKYITDILGGDRDKQLQDKEENKHKFLIKQLGLVYLDRLSAVIDTIVNSGQKPYIRSINTFRTVKLSWSPTIILFQKDNNLYPVYDEDDYDDINDYTTNFANILYKMFCIMKKESLNDWQLRYDYEDCYNGVDTEWGSKPLDINDLPIKLTDVDKLYTLYYVIGKATAENFGILKRPNDYRYMSSRDIDKYNSGKTFSESMNFESINTVLKELIDKTCKKYKIKIK